MEKPNEENPESSGDKLSEALDAPTWWAEYQSAMRFTEQHTSALEEIKNQYQGPDAAGGTGDPFATDHENVAFGMAAWLNPQLVWDNPKVDIESLVDPEEAQAIQGAVNNWITSTDFRGRMVPLALDHTMLFGVACVSLREDRVLGRSLEKYGFKQGSEPQWPVVERIPQDRYFCDPRAVGQFTKEYEGHSWIEPLEEMLRRAEEEDGWDTEALESCSTKHDDSDEVRGRDVPARALVKGVQIWVPNMKVEGSESDPDSGYNGTYLTLACEAGGKTGSRGAKFLREPQPAYISPCGPYQLFGTHTLLNSPFRTSSLATMLPSIRALNHVRRSILEGVSKHKEGILYDLKDANFAKKLIETDGWEAIAVRNLFQNGKPAFAPYKVGGSSPDSYAYLQDLRELVDRYIGQTDMQRGAATGNRTATADSLAAQSADTRLQWIRSQWLEGVTGVLRKVTYLLAVNDRALVPVSGREVGAQPGQMALYQGGAITPSEFQRLHLRLAPYSMERTDEGTRGRRAIETFQLLMQIPQGIATVPGMASMPWREIVDWLGDALNMPELGRFLPEEAIAAMGQGAAAAPPGGARPTLSSASGPRPSAGQKARQELQGPQAGANATEGQRPVPQA